MDKPRVCVTPNTFISNQIMFSNSDIFFIAETNDREKMSKTLNKYSTVLNYAGKTLLVLSEADSCIFQFSFTIVIGTPVGIANASI